MSRQYTISQLAGLAGVPTTTVRYYERIGLVTPEGRSYSNYRLYGPKSLNELRFVKSAQEIGFTLDDIKALLANSASSAPPCGTVQDMIEARLSDIAERQKTLRSIERVLKSALKKCRAQEKQDCCHVVETLQAQSKVP